MNPYTGRLQTERADCCWLSIGLHVKRDTEQPLPGITKTLGARTLIFPVLGQKPSHRARTGAYNYKFWKLNLVDLEPTVVNHMVSSYIFEIIWLTIWFRRIYFEPCG